MGISKPAMSHHRLLLILSTAITALCFGHLVAGAAIAGTIDYNWYLLDWTPDWTPVPRWEWWYAWSSEAKIRGVNVAFWCTIPAVLFLLSLVHTVLLAKKVPMSRRISLALLGTSALLGAVAWATQLGLSGWCIWSTSRAENYTTEFCPFVWGSSGTLHSWREWGSGLLAAWLLPLFVAPFFPLYAAFLFFGIKASRAGASRKVKIVHPDEMDATLLARPEPAIVMPTRQVSDKHTIASSRFTDFAVSSTDGDTTLGPPSYDSASHNSWVSMDEKVALSLALDEKDGKY